MDELAERRERRVLRTEDALRALGLHSAGELLPGLGVWTDPAADPNVIRLLPPTSEVQFDPPVWRYHVDTGTVTPPSPAR